MEVIMSRSRRRFINCLNWKHTSLRTNLVKKRANKKVHQAKIEIPNGNWYKKLFSEAWLWDNRGCYYSNEDVLYWCIKPWHAYRK